MPPFEKRTTSPSELAQGRTRYRYGAEGGNRDFVVEAVAIGDATADAAGFIVLEVTAWEVDAAGLPALVDGQPVAAPPRRCSIAVDALADPTLNVTLEGELTRETAAAADRLHRVRVARAALAQLPKRQNGPTLPPRGPIQ